MLAAARPRDPREKPGENPHPPLSLSQECWWDPVPRCPQQDRSRFGGPGQSGKATAGNPTLEPALSPAPAQQTHQLEDVLVLGHDGELQHIVTAGRGDGGSSWPGSVRPCPQRGQSPMRRRPSPSHAMVPARCCTCSIAACGHPSDPRLPPAPATPRGKMRAAMHPLHVTSLFCLSP